MLKRVFARLGFEVLKKSSWNEYVSSRTELLRRLSDYELDDQVSSEIKGVVFSRDRPMQLHALLSSYFELVKPAVPLSVLVSISDSRFRVAYEDVIQCFSDRDVEFVIESDFRGDLIRVLDRLSCLRVFFLVDDIVFIKPVDLDSIIEFDPLHYIPSLRLGSNIKYCYTFKVPQSMPQNISYKGDFITWRWSEGEFDWGYSVSVDGNIFLLNEILTIAKVSNYNAPNSFEGALLMSKDLFSDRIGICFSTSRLLNIPLNKVQTENDNIYAVGSLEYLLELWNKELSINYKKLYEINNISPHQEVDVSFTYRLGSKSDATLLVE
jgi:hypothetical protein